MRWRLASRTTSQTALVEPHLAAAENEHGKLVKLLLKGGAILRPRDKLDGQMTLLRLAENGDDAKVRLFLEKGVNLEYTSQMGRASLLTAAEKGAREGSKPTTRRRG